MLGSLQKRLIYLRKSKNLSQCELAKTFQTSQPNISRYEKGVIDPSLDIIVLYMNYFKVTFDFIIGLTNDPNYALYYKQKKKSLIN